MTRQGHRSVRRRCRGVLAVACMVASHGALAAATWRSATPQTQTDHVAAERLSVRGR